MQNQSKYEKGPMFSYSFQEMITDPAKYGLPAGTQYDGFTNLRDDRKNEYHINLEGYTYTQLTDVQQEVNGIYTFERKEIFGAPAAIEK